MSRRAPCRVCDGPRSRPLRPLGRHAEMATDIKILYPSKEVVLVHSREQVMPRFHPKLSEIVLEKLGEIGVETVLGSRARIPESGVVEGVKELHLEDGRVIAADLIIVSNLC